MTEQIIDLQEGVMPGPKGERGAKGDAGERGLPGVNAVPADEAVAGYVQAAGSATTMALSDRYLSCVDHIACAGDGRARINRAKAEYTQTRGMMSRLLYSGGWSEKWDAGWQQRWTVSQCSVTADGPCNCVIPMPSGSDPTNGNNYMTRDLPACGVDVNDNTIHIRADMLYDGSIKKETNGGYCLIGVCDDTTPNSMMHAYGFGFCVDDSQTSNNGKIGGFAGSGTSHAGWIALSGAQSKGIYTFDLTLDRTTNMLRCSVTRPGNLIWEVTGYYDLGSINPTKLIIWMPGTLSTEQSPCAIYGVSCMVGRARIPFDANERYGTLDTRYAIRRGDIAREQDGNVISHQLQFVPVNKTDNRLMLPDYRNNNMAPPPLLVYTHGAGQSAENVRENGKMGEITWRALRDGYAVCAHDFGGPYTWGNDTALTAYRDYMRELLTLYPFGPVIVIGESMGGLNSLNAIARHYVPAAAWVGIYPVCNLTYMHSVNFTDSINAAYNIQGDGEFGVKTSGHDPMLMEPGTWGAMPAYITASDGDTIVKKAENADKFAQRLRKGGSQVTLIASTGDHGDTSNFNWDAIKQFLEPLTR